MRYTPKPCDGRAHKIMWLMIAAGALCFMLSSVFAGSRAVLQLGATVLIGGGIYVGVRYIMTEFTYEITVRDTALPQGEAVSAFGGNTADLPASMLDLVVRKQNSRRGGQPQHWHRPSCAYRSLHYRTAGREMRSALHWRKRNRLGCQGRYRKRAAGFSGFGDHGL